MNFIIIASFVVHYNEFPDCFQQLACLQLPTGVLAENQRKLEASIFPTGGLGKNGKRLEKSRASLDLFANRDTNKKKTETRSIPRSFRPKRWPKR